MHQNLQSVLQLEFHGQEEDAIPPATIAQTSLSMARAVLVDAQRLVRPGRPS